MRPNSWDAIIEARSKLLAYIDALWAGRVTASETLRNVYTERLASAAKLASLLRHLGSTTEIRDLVRAENAGFPRDLLATDAGRQARSAFNLLSREAGALEDYRAPDGSISTGPESITGEQLSSVTFMQDYVKLDFNGQGFQVCCPIVIHTAGQSIRREDVGFRDRICDAIGQFVMSVDIGEAALIVAFDQLRIELRFASDAGTINEPLIFNNRDHRTIYVGEK
jgi:hypothetical protein